MESVPFILIDDESQVLDALEIVIRKVIPNAIIAKASDGIDGLKLIKRIGTKSIIICDIDIPGFKGLELLDRIRLEKETSKDYFVLSIEQNQKELGIKALQHGVDDILHKPLSMEEIVSCIKTAIRIVSLESNSNSDTTEVENLRKIYIEELFELAKGFNYPLIESMPRKIERLNFVIEASAWIAEKLNCFESDELEILQKASHLIYIGNLGLPQNSINSAIMKDGFVSDPKMFAVSSFPENLFKTVPTLHQVSYILTSIYENVDGTGFPQKLIASKIPRASRILRVNKDYEHYTIDLNENQNKAIEHLLEYSKRFYDMDIIAYLDQYLATHDASSKLKEYKMSFSTLREGMMISRNIITKNGLLLLPKMTTLTVDTILKIRDITKSDSIIGDFYIFEPKKK
ncbi:MAG: response regulator [Candidatus Kapabacteria bacterium]|nr:response regulator [Candidatus Kapabacteria bacterium]